MYFKRIATLALLSAVTLLPTVTPSFAERTEWVDIQLLHLALDPLDKKGYLPTKVRCKYNTRSNKWTARVDYTKKPKVGKYWHITTSFRSNTEAETMKAKGYTLVNTSTIRSQNSTYSAKCQLWHKDR